MADDVTDRISQSQSFRELLQSISGRLLRELERRSRSRRQPQVDQLQGLILDGDAVAAILNRGTSETEREETLDETTGESGTVELGPVELQLLARAFHLGLLEQRCLALCLLPEIEPEYCKVFAYLQDDVTRKHPTVNLALRLFADGLDARIAARSIFSAEAPLRKNRLLHVGDAGESSMPLPLRTLRLDDRIAAYLVDSAEIDIHLSGWVDVVMPRGEAPVCTVPPELRERTLAFVERCFAGGEAPVRPVLNVHGPYGAGRRSLAEWVCHSVGLPLLIADIRRLAGSAADRAEALWRLGRESFLYPAGILVSHFDDLLAEGCRTELNAFLDGACAFSPVTFLSSRTAWNAPRSVRGQCYLNLACPVPDAGARAEMWRTRIEGMEHALGAVDYRDLAAKFRFTPGQIQDCVLAARSEAFWEQQPPAALTADGVHRSCRGQALPHLAQLARKVDGAFGWSDLVVPADQMEQLREMAAQVRQRQAVLESWGFAARLPNGRGVTALFEGSSGTGKTMAAGIMAAELGLDLYKIDLSCVVSKYIGETERNLSRVFEEAQDSNSILFFDEADALFGKRSEVKDAHDRYANLEIAYLLQRMEEYDGLVILATNMKQNLDDAFLRRIHFMIHFPFPGEPERERIWRQVFPAEAPVADDLDYRWLARKFRLSGGHIRAISVRAAFLAAERGSAIGMECVLEAAKREIEKLGKVHSAPAFTARGGATGPVEVVA